MKGTVVLQNVTDKLSGLLNSIVLLVENANTQMCSLTVGSVQPMESAITVRKVRVERSLAGRPTVRRGKEGTFFFDNQLPGSRFPLPIISPAQPHCGNECYSLLLRYDLNLQSFHHHFSGSAGPFGRDTYDFFLFYVLIPPV